MLFEIAGAETGTSNNIRQALKHCASKPNTEVAVLLFPMIILIIPSLKKDIINFMD